MNKAELARNPVLTDFEFKDLNVDPTIPYGDETFDVHFHSLLPVPINTHIAFLCLNAIRQSASIDTITSQGNKQRRWSCCSGQAGVSGITCTCVVPCLCRSSQMWSVSTTSASRCRYSRWGTSPRMSPLLGRKTQALLWFPTKARRWHTRQQRFCCRGTHPRSIERLHIRHPTTVDE